MLSGDDEIPASLTRIVGFLSCYSLPFPGKKPALLALDLSLSFNLS